MEQCSFADFDCVLKTHALTHADGIMLDLGVSSHQIDRTERGFSYRQDGALDMRMDQREKESAASLIGATDEKALAGILAEYGEVRNPGRMARVICRDASSISTTGDLVAVLKNEYGPHLKPKILSKVFQALRIAVNGELDELRTFLSKAPNCLSAGGRLAIIAYHSLEDRLVKEAFRDTPVSGGGRFAMPPVVSEQKPFLLKRINKKVIRPSEPEVARNRRARSARLRIAEKAI